VKDDRLYLHHMLERCRRLTRFIRPGREAFMASEELQDAVIRNVEVIGEAVDFLRVRTDKRGSRVTGTLGDASGSFLGVGNNAGDDVRVIVNLEIKTPSLGDATLPEVFTFIEFLGV
jgi:hypothetical protein